MTDPRNDDDNAAAGDKPSPVIEAVAASPSPSPSPSPDKKRRVNNKKKKLFLVAACVLVVVALVGGLAGGLTRRSSSRSGDAVAYAAHPERAEAVRAVFGRAWAGYYDVAFPHDSLKPVSNSYVNDRNGWGASAIDALSTALVMGERDAVAQILDFVPTIDFDAVNNTEKAVSVFETTIRYLGGLLSAHDLLVGPLRDEFPVSNATLQALLDQATHIATNLRAAFDTPTGLPVRELLFAPPRIPANLTRNSLAGAGSLTLEWTRLSDKTGNPEFAALAQAAEDLLLDGPGAAVEDDLWPGMRGTRLDVRNASFVDTAGGWSGSSDSYYEYLLKMYLYDRRRFARYRDEWIKAADSSIEFLTSHPSSRPAMTFLATYQGRDNLTYESGHLACFSGGNFILGGLTLSRADYVDFGLELAASCHETYAGSLTGLGPEAFAWVADGSPGPPVELTSRYARTGIWPTNREYLLRPEALESWYHAWRATGDAKYQDWAWDAFLAINATCSVGPGLSGVRDVDAPRGGAFTDHQESFLFAETLKYAYLIQAAEAPWQISATRQNQFVFSTEAHLFAVAGPPT